MALQKKIDALMALNGDIMVIQECSKKAVEFINTLENYSGVWFGTNQNKGLGLIVKAPFRIKSPLDMNLTWAFRAQISGPIEVDLYGIWACAGMGYDHRYIRQVHLVLDQIESQRIGVNTILAGDFNSNAIWDKKYRGRGHSEAVKRLSLLGLKSAYHKYFNLEQGKEEHPTLYLQKNLNKPYHIDYAFLSESLMKSLSLVQVGSFQY